jgi:hypothetical protein
MKFFEKSHTYEYDWETATAAWWDKYPNADQPHVRHWDTLHRELDPLTGRLTVHRLFWIEYGLPKWVSSIFRIPSMDGYGTERVTCDVNKRELVMRGRNYTFRNIIEIEETCTYRPHPVNPTKWTEFIHRAEFRVGRGLGLLAGRLEESARDSALGKSMTGVNVMENLIEKLHVSGWKDKADEWRASAESMRKNIEAESEKMFAEGERMFKQVEEEAVNLYEKVRHPIKAVRGATGGSQANPVDNGDEKSSHK